MKTFSIIIPAYYNERNLPDIMPQLLHLSKELTVTHLELVFVNDGSGGRSKVIFPVRQAQEESGLQKLFSNGYYFLIGRLAMKAYLNGGFDFFMDDPQVAEELNKIRGYWGSISGALSMKYAAHLM